MPRTCTKATPTAATVSASDAGADWLKAGGRRDAVVEVVVEWKVAQNENQSLAYHHPAEQVTTPREDVPRDALYP